MGTTVQNYIPDYKENVIINEYISSEKRKLITVVQKRGISVDYQLAVTKPLEDCNQSSVFDAEYGIEELGSRQKISNDTILNEKKDGRILLLQQVDKEDYQVLDIEDYNNHFNNINSLYSVYFINEESVLFPLSVGTVFTFKYDDTIKLEVKKVLKPRGITKFYKYQVGKV